MTIRQIHKWYIPAFFHVIELIAGGFRVFPCFISLPFCFRQFRFNVVEPNADTGSESEQGQRPSRNKCTAPSLSGLVPYARYQHSIW